MKWVADENVDHPIVLALRRAGHQVWSVMEQEPGLRDDEVLNRARADAAVLLTADKDFGELVFRLRLAPAGVLLLRLAGVPPASKAEMVVRVLREHAAELVGAFSVLTPTSLRVRTLPDAGAS